MTVTETAPEEVASPPEPAPIASETVFTTGDHKRLGLLLLYLGGLAAAGGLLAALVYHLPASADRADVWVAADERLGAAAVVLLFVLGIPAMWTGIATYLVPLQLGATRLALPRLHSLALWAYAVGGVLAVAGMIAGDAPAGGIGAPLPIVGGGTGDAGTLLWITGIALATTGLTLAALSLVTSIATRRAPGMSIARLAPFTWGVLVGSISLLLAAPVFLAGLLLLYIDQAGTGPVFGSVTQGSARVWISSIWLYGRPDVYLMVAPMLAVFTEIVAVAARGRLLVRPAVLGAIAAASLAGLLAWATEPGVVDAAILPTYNVPTALAALPYGLAVLLWLGTMQQGKPGVTPALLFVPAGLLLLATGGVLAGIAALAGVESEAAPAFAAAQITTVVVGPALLAIAAAAVHWAPKLWGRQVSTGMAGLVVLAVLVGTLIAATGGYAVGLGAGANAGRIAIVGYGLLVVAMLIVAAAVAGGGGELAVADPYEGATLEWLAPSPPPRHNFDELPDIRSPYPLLDARGDAAEGASD